MGDTQERSVLRITLQRWSDFAALTPGQCERLVMDLCKSRRTLIGCVRRFQGAASPLPQAQQGAGWHSTHRQVNQAPHRGSGRAIKNRRKSVAFIWGATPGAPFITWGLMAYRLLGGVVPDLAKITTIGIFWGCGTKLVAPESAHTSD